MPSSTGERGDPSHYSLSEILASARVHPFYSSVPYPPHHAPKIEDLDVEKGDELLQLAQFPLLQKNDLYKVIQRLCQDDSPSNGYRNAATISTTGGGSGLSLPMLFLTDVAENKAQRASLARLMKACGMFEPGDWLITVHASGNFYRALDLVTEMYELAGACVLCAGAFMAHDRLLASCIEYRVNILSGDSSQILQFANYVSRQPFTTCNGLRITKIIYTSEMLPPARRQYIATIFGPVRFFSVFASAEAGPWAISNPEMTERGNTGRQENTDNGGDEGSTSDTSDNSSDFIFDSRSMHIEIIPAAGAQPDTSRPGTVVLTSLQRLRNPLVRYVCGDLGTLHVLSAAAAAAVTDPLLAAHLRILRLYGRDQRFSFKWQGEYFELDGLEDVFRAPSWGILQWQIQLGDDARWEGSEYCELKLLRRVAAGHGDDSRLGSEADVVEALRKVFWVTPLNEPLLRIVFVADLEDFRRSVTSGKVIRLVDTRKQISRECGSDNG